MTPDPVPPSRADSSAAYDAGYRDGYCGIRARPETFPGQEDDYLRGHRQGWFKGISGQPRPTI